MQSDHIQGILFDQPTELDLSRHTLASRLARAMAARRHHLTKRISTAKASRSGQRDKAYLFDVHSATYEQDVATLAHRLRSYRTDDKA